ncbi:MAG: hypothetical protein J7L55_04920 [Desulfurococcales archaeon]|nr:hypothetical protein [Desulfurococcales archaeon]
MSASGAGRVRAALWISYALNANTYAVMLATLILWVEGDLTLTSFLTELAFFGLLPLLPILINAVRGKVDVFVSERGDRPIYFILAVAAYAGGYLTYRFLLLDRHLSYFILTYAVVTGAMAVFTLKWKASVHACGISGPTTYMVINFGMPYAALYLLLVPIYFARHSLKAHSPFELALGTIVGVMFTLLTALFVAVAPQLLP